jgi:ribosome biogenesis GTPase
VHKPEPDLLLAEKLIYAARKNNIKPYIIINKCDIDQSGAEELADQMCQSGAVVLNISVKNQIGLDELKMILKNNTSCFAGQSAVGKSSISSCFLPDMKLNTGGLSKKTDRGKHTTRCCELFCFDDNSYIVDTPGFSLFDDILIDPDEFVLNFDDKYFSLSENCRFRGCSHTSEPDCAIKNAVLNGELSKVRYERYCKLYQQINENWKRTDSIKKLQLLYCNQVIEDKNKSIEGLNKSLKQKNSIIKYGGTVSVLTIILCLLLK